MSCDKIQQYRLVNNNAVPYIYVRTYVSSSYIARVWINRVISLSPFAPEKLISRHGFGRVPSRVSLLVSILGLNLVLAYGIPPDIRDA